MKSAAGMTGFEPAISALTGQRVWPLHYTPEPGVVYHTARFTGRTSKLRFRRRRVQLHRHRSNNARPSAFDADCER